MLTARRVNMICPHMANAQPAGQPATTPESAALPRVPANRRIYAIGDVHGRADLLVQLHEQIARDGARGGADQHAIVYLGDYVDRGPDSSRVLDILAGGPPPGFEAVYLKGNHEDLMLTFLEAGTMLRAWLSNGGAATMKSYGVGTLGILMGESGVERIRRKLSEAVPPPHMALLGGLSLTHREGDYLFVHAGIRPGLDLDRQDETDLLWIRHDFLDAEEDFGCVVVHGHTITAGPDIRRNRIGIDTGAYDSGRLTCLVLEGAERRFLSTGD